MGWSLTKLKLRLLKRVMILITFLCGPQLAQADLLRYMPSSESALASFLDLIHNSRQFISLTTFIFEPCHASTQVIMDALVSKARSGVKVRILLDRFMHDKKQVRYLTGYFESRGIEIRWFNTSFINTNFRSHIKLIVADGRSYIAGGRNIADEYFGLYRGANFIDRDLYVSGRSAKEAQEVFNRMWQSNWTSRIKSNAKIQNWAEVCDVNEASRVAEIKAHFKEKRAALVNSLRVRSCAETQFFADAPGATILQPHQDGVTTAEYKKKYVTGEVLKFVRDTKKHLVLENWSLMPHERMSYEFFNLRWKNVPVIVLTNDNMDGPGVLKYAEDSFNNRAARRQDVGSVDVIQLSMHGSLQDNWGLSPSQTEFRLHGKVGVRDNKDVMVSSYNIDNRSYSLNMESMVLVKNCPALAKDLGAGFGELLKVHRQDRAAGVPPNNTDNLLWSILGVLGYSFF